MPDAGYQSIPAKPDTKERITQLKRGNQTYDDVLKKLLELADVE